MFLSAVSSWTSAAICVCVGGQAQWNLFRAHHRDTHTIDIYTYTYILYIYIYIYMERENAIAADTVNYP